MNIEQFMQGYKAAWEQRDESAFSALFAADGQVPGHFDRESMDLGWKTKQR